MARGRRNDRTGQRTPSGSGHADGTGNGTAAVPSSYETVEYEEIAGTGVANTAPVEVAADAGVEIADSARDEVMTQQGDGEAVVSEVVAPVEPERQPPFAAEPPRRGGFVPGLIGGLLGGAAIVLAGGWYGYQHGPIKAGLERLDATAAGLTDAQAGLADAQAGVKTLDGKLEQAGASLASLTADLGGLKTTLEGTQASLGTLGDRISSEEAATGELKTNLEQASNSFRAAGEQVIGRLEAVNAKLVEVEQAQPADVVDKKTVSDIAAKQVSVDAATQSVAAALARLEQLVTQSLEAGNQQAAGLRTVVDATQKRLDEVNAQQRELLALKDQVAKQEEADQKQLAALADTGNQVTGVRTDLENRLQEVTGRLTALDAARERGVGLSIAAHGLEQALTTGEPFQPTMGIIHELGQGDAVITDVVAKLEPLAAGGVPTYGKLAAQLDQVQQGLAAAATPAPSDDWLTRTTDNLQGLIDLRAADAEAVPGQNAVESASQALLQQDLPAAIAALQPLADHGNEAAKAWIASAQQRLEATSAVAALLEQVKSILAQQG